ncbi:MAG: hypothetical protein FJY85_17585 [Deltaproteobacteria bacterium]|nr:hypothetical protein [Deltaproteobacteria bacterium]
MSDFVYVSVPAGLADRIDSDVVLVRSGSCREIVKAYEALGDRVREVELHGLGEELYLLSGLPVGLPLTVRLHPKDAPQVYTNTWLMDRFSMGVLLDVDTGLIQGVRIITSAMIPVTLNLDAVHCAKELMSTLLFYLHEPHLQTPVEFFHSMFNAVLQNSPLSLADLYPESPEALLYVDESCRITCSARLARAGMFLGELSDGLRIDRESPVYKGLVDRKKQLFLSSSPCMSCEQFDLCEGYLRVADDAFDCEPFLRVFAELKAKAKEMAEDLSRADLPRE